MRFKGKIKSELFDALFFNIGNFLYLGSQWIISIVLVRLGGFEDAGLFSLAMTIGSVMVVVSSYGLRTFQVSDVNCRFSDFTYIATRFFTMVIAAVLCVIFTAVREYEFRTQAIIGIYMVYKTIESYNDVLNGIWQKNGYIKKVGISLATKGFWNTASFILSYIILKDLFLSVTIMCLSSFLVLFIYDFKHTKKIVHQREVFGNIDFNQIYALLKQGFFTMFSTMCVILFNSIPKLIIEDLLSTELHGVFSSIATPTVIISTFAAGMLMPVASQMAENYNSGNIKKLVKLVCGCNLVIICIGVLATFFSAIAGEFVFELVFGKAILPYFKLFYYMIWVSVLIAIVNCYTTVLIAVRKLKVLLAFSATACVIEFALCMLLTGNKSIYGAGYAMLIALVIQFVTETIYIIYLLNRRKKEA